MTNVIQMPEVVANLWRTQQALAKHYKSTGLKFTLDGRLVGDVAEALAIEHFDLLPPPRRTPGIDALTRCNRTVQVKATGRPGSGPSFTRGKACADFLLFFRLDFEANTASVLYNGPEAPVRQVLPAEWNGTFCVPITSMRELANKLVDAQRLPIRSATLISDANTTGALHGLSGT